MNEVFFSFVIGVFLTLVLVPPLMRLSVPLQLTDPPQDRKVHHDPVPRCGGIAMAAGTLVPILIWLPIDAKVGSILAGGAVIIMFGIWDDRVELKYQWKILGQLVAVALLIHGGVVLTHLPFTGLDPVPPLVSYPVTTLFVLAVTNALNLTDGLDGLAAGCALLTLGLIALLGFLGNGFEVVIIAMALMGSLIGFLRYNTHPAIVFMGDAGSQFLGFNITALTIYLFENVHRSLSPALPLLFLALPLLDVIWVVSQRLLAKRSPFLPDKNHIHHKLLEIGFRHGEAVALIYLMHGVMVTLALVFRYDTDILISLIFAIFVLSFIGAFYYGKAHSWSPHPGLKENVRSFHTIRTFLNSLTWISVASARGIAAAIIFYLLGGAAVAREVSPDTSVVSFSVVGILLLAEILTPSWKGLFTRIGLYAVSVLVVFLTTPIPTIYGVSDLTIDLYFCILLAAMGIFYYLNRRFFFQVTPQDLLVLLFAILIPNLSPELFGDFHLGRFTFRLIILFYAIELLLNPLSESSRDPHSYRALRIAAPICLAIIGLKGI